jgi:hypothetical protein
MNNKDTQLAAIPVDFVVEQGLQEHTEAKRRPYRSLIRTWAEHEGMTEQGEIAISRLSTNFGPERLKDLQNLPCSIAPKYRKGEKAELLVKIIRQINEQMKNDSNWKWSYVMKVMLDEGILMTNVPNKFDRLICSMIPGKGIDTVRKNGNYSILEDQRSWSSWNPDPSRNVEKFADRMVCEDIYNYLKPLFS